MNEIKETYVSFDTAKLLKEKGFPQYLGEEGCINMIPYYTQNGQLITCDINTIRQRYVCEAVAPTQQMAMKWLREEYDFFIAIRPCKDSIKLSFEIYEKDFCYEQPCWYKANIVCENKFVSYEEAVYDERKN